MSASNEWTEWHLTPQGWERGSEKVDFSDVKAKVRPADAVLTVKWREYLSSMHSQNWDRSHREIWRSDDKVTMEILSAKYGDAPKSL